MAGCLFLVVHNVCQDEGGPIGVLPEGAYCLNLGQFELVDVEQGVQ